MSTPDQLLCVAPHGTDMRYAAERCNLADSIAELREMARDDVLGEAAGIEAGSWYAWPLHACRTRAHWCRNVDHGRRKQRHAVGP
jgi:hypothetical protein